MLGDSSRQCAPVGTGVDAGDRRWSPELPSERRTTFWLLSDKASGEVLAAWVGVGGSPGDADHGDVDHKGRTTMTAPEFNKNRLRRQTLKLGLRRH